MSVTDNDLEMMEALLDGELSEEQADALRRRMSGEPELAQVMDHLRGDRQLRGRAWQSLEPSAHDSDALINNVRIAVRKEELWGRRVRVLRSFSGVAAAIAMVFTAGWISRGKLHYGPVSEPINLPSPAIVINNANPMPAVPVSSNSGTLADAVARGPVVGIPRDRNGMSTVRPTFKVIVVDPFNNVIGFKALENADDALKLGNEFVAFEQNRQSSPQINPSQSPPVGQPPVLVDQPQPHP